MENLNQKKDSISVRGVNPQGRQLRPISGDGSEWLGWHCQNADSLLHASQSSPEIELSLAAPLDFGYYGVWFSRQQSLYFEEKFR
jgi:hypothetical protein